MSRDPRVLIAVALVVLAAGILAVVDVGGVPADVLGVAAAAAALTVICRVAFRIAARDPRRPPRDGRPLR